MNSPAPATYRGLEGLRGILAWIVVLSHVPLQTGIGLRLPGSYAMLKAGDWAVEAFIVVSGFVITHLVLVRAEPYRIFILRRAFRLFPAYLTCLALAMAVQPYELRFLADLPWGNEPRFMNHLVPQAQEMAEGRGPLHALAHLTLLHGAIPNGVLYESSLMFLPPAWSLSLEWQFYLLAPFLILALRTHPLPTLLAFAGLTLAFRAGLFGAFFVPSFLPGVLMIFLIGMATRLLFDATGPFATFPVWLAVVALALMFMSPALIVPAIWLIVAAYMKTSEQAEDRSTRCLSRLLDSRPMRALGARSYGVYLIHWPILALTTSFAVAVLKLDVWGTFIFTGLVGPALTAIAAEILHRLIERPGIERGQSLARALAKRGHQRTASPAGPRPEGQG